MFEPCWVLGVPVHRVTRRELRDRLDAQICSGRPHQIVTVNVDFLRLARGDVAFRETISAADLAVPDGVPVLWLARLCGEQLLERVTGIDLLHLGAALAAERGYRLFLLGAEPGVAEAAAWVLEGSYPGLRIAGTLAPPYKPLTEQEEASIVARVRAARADMLFVALGAPRQDLWIRRHMADLGVPVSVGVGGAFDLVAGRIPRAPAWIQRLGLEWVYRLKQEPARLWRRYLLGDIPFFARAVGSAVLSTARH
jgi:N-acetylglucosaminyldiphosphoundecaprenol N-acetyl-beta-D-mannosaminyltransferase